MNFALNAQAVRVTHQALLKHLLSSPFVIAILPLSFSSAGTKSFHVCPPNAVLSCCWWANEEKSLQALHS